jgi:hypothetical protein
MKLQEKINAELESLKYERKQALESFENEKKAVIKILTDADPKTVCELEERYQAAINLKKYARRIEIIDAKLRVYNYLNSEE